MIARSARRFFSALPLTLALVACGGDEDGAAAVPTTPVLDDAAAEAERLALRNLILGIASPELPAAQEPTEVLPATETTELASDTIMKCTYRRYTGTAQYESLVSFDPNADALWPGSVVQSKSLPEGLLSPIALPRNPGTVTLTNAILGDQADAYSALIADPTQASVQAAVAGILSAKDIHLAAKASYVAEQVHSLEEGALKAGVAVDWMTGSVKSSFDGSFSKKRSTFIVRFTQSYYTVSFSAPEAPEALFADGVTVDDAKPYMAANNPPGYVASVTYGRMLFVKIESDDEASDVKAAIDAVFTAGAVDGQVTVEGSLSEVMNRATVTVFALGGSPEDAVEIMTSSTDRAEKLAAYFEEGASFSAASPGVPIGYTVRTLRDNTPIKVASTTDYSVPECGADMSTLHITLDGFSVPMNGEAIGNGEIGYKIWIDDQLVVDGQRSHVADGDFIDIGDERVVTLPKTHGTTFTVKSEVSESGQKHVYPTRTHTFFVDDATISGEFTQLGANEVEQSNGNLDVKMVYTVTAN
jgi:thiol-activated cytolysin